MKWFVISFLVSVSAFAENMTFDINSDNLAGFSLDPTGCEAREGSAHPASIRRAVYTLALKGERTIQVDLRGPIQLAEKLGSSKEEACLAAWQTEWANNALLRENVDALISIQQKRFMLVNGVCAKPFFRVYGPVSEGQILSPGQFRLKYEPCN